jgi:HPt (histidine-containing phosphotransfer) domain-containing protein
MSVFSSTAVYVQQLQQENAELKKQLKEQTELQETHKELDKAFKELWLLNYGLGEELEEVQRELEELKRDKAIQKLGGLKLCYKS